MKRRLLAAIRAAGLLGAADRIMFLRASLAARGRNRAFRHTHPGFATPPADLAFDAYHHVDHAAYRDSGAAQAALFARLIAETVPARPLAVLEWGSGPGRIIRHLPTALGDALGDLAGSDVNPRSVAWCRAHLPGIDFVTNGFDPPLPFPAARFDAVYTFSVFTHLSEPAQRAWAREVHRVLRPGGAFIASTHGDRHVERLARAGEADAYRAGRPVVQAGYAEGRKWFLALHPPEYVRHDLLRDFAEVRRLALDADETFGHDLWVARKAASGTTAGDAARAA